jgi:Trypsin-like peptidase domain
MRMKQMEFTRRIGGFGVAFGLALILVLYMPETGTSLSKPDYVSSAKARFVLVTSECKLGSGFLTGYREEGKAEVVTAYHLIRCRSGRAKRKSKIVQVDGVVAEIHGADPQQDLLRLLVPLPKTTDQIAIRTNSSTGEPVFAVGSNPRGERSVITWGSVLVTAPGFVTAKVPIVPGTSGGQLVSAVDGAFLGMPVRAEFGFTDAVGGNVLLQFLEKNRCR